MATGPSASENQFVIVVLEPEASANTHSSSGPWGSDVSSSQPYPSGGLGAVDVAVRVLPRANERDVDPRSLKSRLP